MYKLVIGIDVSKEVLDIAYYFQNEIKYLMQIQNSPAGIAEFLIKIKQITKLESTDLWLVCFENTGAYSKLLRATLLSVDIDCIEENAVRIISYNSFTRGKKDDWDASRICEYAVANQHRLTLSKLTDKNLDRLKHLFNYRTVLVDKKRALSNAVNEKYDALGPEFMSEIHDHNEQILDLIKEKIKVLEKRMIEIIDSQQGIKKNFNLCTSVIGIGNVIGIALIIKTENFTKFTDPRKFASQIGIAPFPHQSGKTYGKTRVCKMADIEMKALISNGVNAAINFDPQIGNYHKRLKDDNKNAGIIRNNIKNKLIHRVFSVVNRGTPYVKLAA